MGGSATERGPSGPVQTLPPRRLELRPGLWITSGRAAVLEGPGHLLMIDPGDEPCGEPVAPRGPLADVAAVARATGKPLRHILITHAHPDHVANLAAFCGLGAVQVWAHPASPVAGTRELGEGFARDLGPGLEVLATPGHSAWGDDLSFWVPSLGTLFSGDLVQPKGETWETTFYPSPYPFFIDGDTYCSSLDRLLHLPLEILVTGHREIRTGADARRWLEVTRRAVSAVGDAVDAWQGSEQLEVAGPEIWRRLAADRGVPMSSVEARLRRAGPAALSAFQNFDLPGIRYYWGRRFGCGEEEGP